MSAAQWLQTVAQSGRVRAAAAGLVWFLMVWGALEALVAATIKATDTNEQVSGCKADNEGQWSIGIFKGATPLNLQPIEQWQPRADSKAAWPVANPVLTCAHVTDVPSSFVADPFLWPKDKDHWYLFYETKSIHNMQGDIGVAESSDGGQTWKHNSVVLDEPWHLSYPFVFEHEGKMYLMPEGSKSGTLRLYSTDTFPTGWKLEKVLIPEPLIDASLVMPMKGVADSDGKWYIFASNRNQPTSKNCRELEIWVADDLLGPWRLHPLSPVRSGVQGSRMAGRPVVADGKLYRFGQDCTYTYGHKVRAFHVTTLNSTHFSETELSLGFDPASGRTGDHTWNSLRHHHMDAHLLSNGEWVAVMDGDRYRSDYMTWRSLQRLPYVLTLALLLSVITGLLYAYGAAGVVYAGSAVACGASSAWHRAVSVLPDPIRTRLSGSAYPGGCVDGYVTVATNGCDSEAPVKRPVGARSPSKGRRGTLLTVWHSVDTTLQRPLFCCAGATGWQLTTAALLLCIFGWTIHMLMWHWGRLKVLAGIMWYLRTWGGSSLPIALNHQHSKFTMVVMSYEARLITLQAFVSHYSQCTSVSEIVVVWNKGTPPRVPEDLPSELPVRVRAEKQNSMNNRFQLDPHIHTRAVLMLDDDILMPCRDIERGFARWRQHPDRITGYYPRILEGPVPQYLCTQCERHTYESGKYNTILAGASFQDQEVIFKEYSAPENKAGRDYVDRVFNCDDLLLNYLMANRMNGSQYVEWVRPTKRYDVGKLTSKRLSTGNFGPVRHKCTQDFAAMFGNPLKDKSYPLNFEQLGKPMCPTGIGCMFI